MGLLLTTIKKVILKGCCSCRGCGRQEFKVFVKISAILSTKMLASGNCAYFGAHYLKPLSVCLVTTVVDRWNKEDNRGISGLG